MKRIIIILFILMNAWAFGKDKIYFNEKRVKDLFLKSGSKIYITSTSELVENDIIFYDKNLINDQTDLPWATRKNGGVGEEIMIMFDRPDPFSNEKWVKGIKIINGFHRNKQLYDLNNRVKDIDLYLYKIIYDVRQDIGEVILGLFLIESNNIQLKDDYNLNNSFYFKTDLDKEHKENRFDKYVEDISKYTIVFKIKSVYKGSKYNDLCISKINFLYNWPETNSVKSEGTNISSVTNAKK